MYVNVINSGMEYHQTSINSRRKKSLGAVLKIRSHRCPESVVIIFYGVYYSYHSKLLNCWLIYVSTTTKSVSSSSSWLRVALSFSIEILSFSGLVSTKTTDLLNIFIGMDSRLSWALTSLCVKKAEPTFLIWVFNSSSFSGHTLQ